MVEVYYDIDLTENEYVHFDGKTFREFEDFLYKDKIFKDCCGYINVHDNGVKTATIAIASLRDYGVFIGYSDRNEEKLSLADRSRLDSVLDVWGDGLYVSEGLFIEPEKAWKAITEFVSSGKITQDIEWITPDDIPEDGNFII